MHAGAVAYLCMPPLPLQEPDDIKVCSLGLGGAVTQFMGRTMHSARQACREEPHLCFMDLRVPKMVIHWRPRKPRRAFFRWEPRTGSSSSGATISSSDESSIEGRPRFFPVTCIAGTACLGGGFRMQTAGVGGIMVS